MYRMVVPLPLVERRTNHHYFFVPSTQRTVPACFKEREQPCDQPVPAIVRHGLFILSTLYASRSSITMPVGARWMSAP